MPPASAPSAPAGRGGPEAAPAVSAPPPLVEATNPAQITEQHRKADQLNHMPPGARMDILDREHEAAKAAGAVSPGAAEVVAPGGTQAAAAPETGLQPPTAGVTAEEAVGNGGVMPGISVQAAQEAGQAGQEDDAAGSTQAAEQTTPNQPSEERIQQALKAMGKEDTVANRVLAIQLIAAKEQQEAEAAAQRVVDSVTGKEKQEPELSPDERALMQGFTEMMSENMEGFKKFYAALKQDDPEFAKQLGENLERYAKLVSKEKDARNKMLSMALGGALFFIWLTWNTLGPSAGGQ